MPIVTFTEDQKAKLLKDSKDLFFAAQQLHEWVQKDQLQQDMAGILPNLIESHFVSISQALNYDSYLQKEHEQRYVEIRNANQRVRDLEDQLASGKPIEGLAEQLNGLRDVVYDWWREEGFRHISEIWFTGHGSMKVEFSFMLDTSSDAFLCDTPVTNAKNKLNKIQQLIAFGFELERESKHSRSWEVLDTENNRRLLVEMLEKRFPSINIAKIDSWAKGGKKNNEKFTLWRIEAYIHDLRDIPIGDGQV